MSADSGRTRREAVRLGARINRNTGRMHHEVEALGTNLHDLLRRPGVLPLAFGLGFLAERLDPGDLKSLRRLLPAHWTLLQVAAELLESGRSPPGPP